ncbi:MAG: hypothetical protein U1E76_12265 [Planctomycetota bacterium]
MPYDLGHPIGGISERDAVAFCDWLDAQAQELGRQRQVLPAVGRRMGEGRARRGLSLLAVRQRLPIRALAICSPAAPKPG